MRKDFEFQCFLKKNIPMKIKNVLPEMERTFYFLEGTSPWPSFDKLRTGPSKGEF
jgi:hypothetical protein